MQEIDTRQDTTRQGYTMLGTCGNCLSQSVVTYSYHAERRTMLKCPECGGLCKFKLEAYSSQLLCICGGELEKLDDRHVLCHACNDAKVEMLNQHNDMLGAVQMAYRKHHLNDDSIGWEELSDRLLDALCNVMGADGHLKWLEEVKK